MRRLSMVMLGMGMVMLVTVMGMGMVTGGPGSSRPSAEGLGSSRPATGAWRRQRHDPLT